LQVQLLWWWYVSVPDVSGDFAFGAPAFGISAFFGIPAFGISAFGNSAFGDSAPLPVGVVLVVNYDPVAISLQGAESLESGIGRPLAIRTDLPLLIIDDYPESEANATFLSGLYTQAWATQIPVLILTKDSEWANKMITINGGVKILPMDKVIRNPRGDRVTPFAVVPDQTGRMAWTLVEDLRKFAATLGDPDISADLVEGMTPTEAMRLHARREWG
jgi:hypothetical protein